MRLQGDIGELITPGQDQVLILDLGDSETPLETALACLGRPYQPAVRVQIV